jgi:G:T-mismatch repair DNA endonuclease (very short patch repair protein)
MRQTAYELLDRETTEEMLHTERICAFWKQHATPWTASISKATHNIRYWDARLARKCVRDIHDVILN